MVDAILNDLGDTATIFMKDGDDFLRISTNVKKADGARAIGTKLGKDSAAYTPSHREDRMSATPTYWASLISQATSLSRGRTET
jgi:hypothetical protein